MMFLSSSKAFVENQFDCHIKAFQSDWGGEFRSLTSFLHDSGISHRVSCPYTPQQNGLAERKNRHVIEMDLALLHQSGLPMCFWDDAFATATYTINRIPSVVLKFISPYEKLLSSKPNYLEMKAFGCLCYPHLRPYNNNKLEFRSVAATFMGYSGSHKGYKALLPSGKVVITRDIVFDELTFPHHNTPVNSHVSCPTQHSAIPVSPTHFLPVTPAHTRLHHSPAPPTVPTTPNCQSSADSINSISPTNI